MKIVVRGAERVLEVFGPVSRLSVLVHKNQIQIYHTPRKVFSSTKMST
jgi:hypothetical protein